jgi:hypothetical protein
MNHYMIAVSGAILRELGGHEQDRGPHRRALFRRRGHDHARFALPVAISAAAVGDDALVALILAPS